MQLFSATLAPRLVIPIVMLTGCIGQVGEPSPNNTLPVTARTSQFVALQPRTPPVLDA